MKASRFFRFTQTAYKTRGHPYKLLHSHCRVSVCKHFFAECVVKPWNSLVVQPSDFKSHAAFEKCTVQNASNLEKLLIIN
jgi:hypothetical protein